MNTSLYDILQNYDSKVHNQTLRGRMGVSFCLIRPLRSHALFRDRIARSVSQWSHAKYYSQDLIIISSHMICFAHNYWTISHNTKELNHGQLRIFIRRSIKVLRTLVAGRPDHILTYLDNLSYKNSMIYVEKYNILLESSSDTLRF